MESIKQAAKSLSDISYLVQGKKKRRSMKDRRDWRDRRVRIRARTKPRFIFDGEIALPFTEQSL